MTVELSTIGAGLRLVTDRIDTVETVSLGVWVHAGARNETLPEHGVSHLLEHMAFKGTSRRNARQIAEEIEAVGGHLNAYTSREFTVYYATVLAGDEALAVDIIADILQDSLYDETELTRERAVVLQEIGQARDTPDDIIFDLFQETAYPDQPIGRPVLGTEESVTALGRDALAGYQAAHYAAPRMVVAAAGKLDHDALHRMVAGAFDRVAAPPAEAPVPAVYRGGDFREARRLEQVHLVLGFGAVPYGDPDYYAVSVLSTLLGGGMSSRLFQVIREERGLVYSIYSFGSTYADGGLLGVYAGTGRDEAAELVPLLCSEIASLRHNVADDEVARARAQLKAGILMSLESTASRAEQLARQLLIYGRIVPIPEITEKIEAVDPAHVARAAARLLATRPTVATMGPIERMPDYDGFAEQLAATQG